MLVYVVTFIVCAALLLAAFRSMGEGPLDAGGTAEMLERIAGWVGSDLAAVADLAGVPEHELPTTPLTERASRSRKALAGYQQQLAQLEPGGVANVEAMKSALVRTIESLGWACRMAEMTNLRDNTAVSDAAALLYADARDNLSVARGNP